MAAESENASATMSRVPKPGKKYFTLDEANRALPYVTRIMNDIVACYGQVLEIRRKLDRSASADNRAETERDYDHAMDRLSGFMDELQQVGVELKDFEKGLLDFPAVHEGREIYLCWHRGEHKVHTWHEVDAGFAGRQDAAALK